MGSLLDFISLCNDSIQEVKVGQLSQIEAANKIAYFDFQDELLIHPMISEICSIAYELSEMYLSKDDVKLNWEQLVNTLKSYTDHKWYSTTWMLYLVYGKFEQEKLIESFNVVIRRRNGKTIIESALEVLRKNIEGVSLKINPDQTDEWYLRNLKEIVPGIVNKNKLLDTEIYVYQLK